LVRRSVVVVLAVAFVAMFAACGWDWTVVPKAEGAAVDGGADAEKGAPCTSNDQCGSDQYCFFLDGRCGAGEPGRCNSTPAKCEGAGGDPDVACGCDGKTATNRCGVELTRTDLSVEASCAAPPDTFRCGFLFCPRSTFCFEVRQPDYIDFVCIPWQCQERTCACPDTTAKCESATCSADGTGATFVVCAE
jgi:hypothetical protein